MVFENVIILYFLVVINLLFGKLKDFSCNMQGVINDSVFVRHMLNIIGVFFLLVLFTRTTPINPLILVLATFVMYIFFILITRCDYRFVFVFIFCMLIVFYIEAQKNFTTDKLPDNNKKEERKKYEKIQYIVEVISVVCVIIGVLIYMGQHSREYKNNWNWNLFWFGTLKCRGNGVPVLKSIREDSIDGIIRLFGYKPYR
jgi:hypothetical protein